ncbi:hypothetical protein ACFWPH_29545 [Nocardia sp. NPDC058499]|uniref:hypothetical protein n=1 Tax=Nocardia sp. NPDC058499 TaxID=3346530 RepID=UPI00366875D3
MHSDPVVDGSCRHPASPECAVATALRCSCKPRDARPPRASPTAFVRPVGELAAVDGTPWIGDVEGLRGMLEPSGTRLSPGELLTEPVGTVAAILTGPPGR